jgi:hypothetical protein
MAPVPLECGRCSSGLPPNDTPSPCAFSSSKSRFDIIDKSAPYWPVKLRSHPSSAVGLPSECRAVAAARCARMHSTHCQYTIHTMVQWYAKKKR